MPDNVGEDFIRELLQSADPEKLASFLRELKPDKPKKYHDRHKENSPVKSYTTVIKNYTCIACGHNFSTSYKMEKGDQTALLDKKGTVHSITSSGNEGTVTLLSYCSKCDYCRIQASLWSREELEDRWIALVEASSFKEKMTCQVIIGSGRMEVKL